MTCHIIPLFIIITYDEYIYHVFFMYFLWPINILSYSILFLIVYQTLHMIDHLLQYYELYFLKMSPPPGLFEGLFNASDTKVHLWLNGIEYVVILIIAISFFKSFRFIKMN
jgi:hypothetical protein